MEKKIKKALRKFSNLSFALGMMLIIKIKLRVKFSFVGHTIEDRGGVAASGG